MLDEAIKKRIHNEIANATVKILVAGEFQGSGVFITPDGYVLTAYHCIGECPPTITVETRFGEQFNAELDEAKSLKHPDYDIAVLKVYDKATHYLPLGIISTQNVTDEIVTTGYPAGSIKDNQEIGIYFGNISRFRGHKIENDAMKGRGHSGGLVYHYLTHRVIGLVTEGYKSEVMLNTGLATRFDTLFQKWPGLETINNKVAQVWEKRLLELGYKDSPLTSDVQTPTSNKGDTSLTVSGKIKIQFCRRLGKDWQDLATCLEIPAHRCNQFPQGRECHAIWEWLEERKQLHTLKEALSSLERQDLVELLNTNNKVS